MTAQQPTLLNLLGVAQIIPETPAAKKSPACAPGVFDMIFQSFMAEQIPTPMVDMPNPEVANDDQISNAFSVQSDRQTIDEPANGLSIESDSAGLIGLTSDMSIPMAQVENGNVATSTVKLPRILEAIATALPQGNYSVTATTIENGVVTFDLTSDKAGQSLKISIPLDSIDTQIENSINRSQQSNGNFATIRDGIDIEQLLARANVTSIDISTTSHTDTAQNVIAINATQQGRAISLFAIPRPAEIVTQVLPQATQAIHQHKSKSAALQVPEETLTNGLVPSEDLAGESSSILESDVSDEPTVSANESARRTPVTSKFAYVETKTSTSNLEPTIENQWGRQTQADSVIDNEVQSNNKPMVDNSPLGETTSDILASTVSNASTPRSESARMHTAHLPHSALTKTPTSSDFGAPSAPEITASFTLPKDLEAMTLHAGRTNSVTLQLNPEHLGTARVHLTVQNDIVSARVVVDSHHAKAVVESSLNELLTQFERANIRVEQIQVAVSGEWQNSEHNRRQFWQAPRPSSRFMKDPDETSDSITGAVAKLFAPKQTPAFAGLNILA